MTALEIEVVWNLHNPDVKLSTQPWIDVWVPDRAIVRSVSLVSGAEIPPQECDTIAPRTARASMLVHLRVQTPDGSTLVPLTFEPPTTDAFLVARLYALCPSTMNPCRGQSQTRADRLDVQCLGHAVVRDDESESILFILNEDVGPSFPTYATLNVRSRGQRYVVPIDSAGTVDDAVTTTMHNECDLAWILAAKNRGAVDPRVGSFCGQPCRNALVGEPRADSACSYFGNLVQTEILPGTSPPAVEAWYERRLAEAGWDASAPYNDRTRTLVRAVQSFTLTRRFVPDAHPAEPDEEYELTLGGLCIPGDCDDAAVAIFRLWRHLLLNPFTSRAVVAAQAHARSLGMPVVVTGGVVNCRDARARATDAAALSAHRFVVVVPWKRFARALYDADDLEAVFPIPPFSADSVTAPLVILDGVFPVVDFAHTRGLSAYEDFCSDVATKPFDCRDFYALYPTRTDDFSPHRLLVRAEIDTELISKATRTRHASRTLTTIAESGTWGAIDVVRDVDVTLDRTRMFVFAHATKIGAPLESAWRLVRATGVARSTFESHRRLALLVRPIVPLTSHDVDEGEIVDLLMDVFGTDHRTTHREANEILAIVFYHDARVPSRKQSGALLALRSRLGGDRVGVSVEAFSSGVRLAFFV
jgi:hypothetical protein